MGEAEGYSKTVGVGVRLRQQLKILMKCWVYYYQEKIARYISFRFQYFISSLHKTHEYAPSHQPSPRLSSAPPVTAASNSVSVLHQVFQN